MHPSHSRFSAWKTLLLVGSVVAVLAALPQRTSTEAPVPSPSFDAYIHRLDGSAADPVNIIFYGASPNDVATTVHRVLGWPFTAGSSMTFVDQGIVRATAWQLGQEVNRSARLHLRIEALTAQDEQDYVLAAVHRDDGAACGHVGGAFDPTRATVASAFAAAGYGITPVWLGNTRPGPQCDGSFTAGDGMAIAIDLSPDSDRR